MSPFLVEQKPSPSSASLELTKNMVSRGYSIWSDEEEFEKECFVEDSDQDYIEEIDQSDYYYDDDDLHSDLYGDFSLKAKAPPPLTRPGQSPAQKANSKSLKPHSTTPLSSSDRKPLLEHKPDTTTLTLPPEVLHLIFSYLDNTTLCHGINYVSHQFNAIAKYYIKCTWTLGTQKEEDSLIEKLRLGKVNSLKIKYSTRPPKYSGRSQPFDEWDCAWKRFRNIITHPIEGTKGVCDEQSIMDHPTVSTKTMSISDEKNRAPCLLQGVKKLIMDGGDLWTPEYLPALLPFLRSIHTLVLKPQSWSQTLKIPWQRSQIFEIPLQSVLEACPSIDTLVINGAVSLCLNNDALPTSTQDTWHTFRLTRFITTNATTTQETMETFLSACPRLVSFHAKNIHIRTPGTPRHDLLNTPSLPITSLLLHAAFLCPNLVDISITPSSCAPINTFESLLAKIAQLFPRTKHLDVETGVFIYPSWVPTSTVAKFLAQLTSIEFFSHSAQGVDRLLKHTHALERLNSCSLAILWFRDIKHPTVNDIADAMVEARVKRGQDPAFYSSRVNSTYYCQLYIREHSKLSQQISKRLLREKKMNLRYLTLAASSRCLHLHEVELNVPAGKQEGVFQFLKHACPNVEHLTLHLSELKVRQAVRAMRVTHETYKKTETTWRPRAPKHRRWTCTYLVHRPVHTDYWTTHESTLEALGGLLRLETLVLMCAKVPGVLCPKDFAFMRTEGARRGEARGGSGCGIEGGDAVDDQVFCPRLKELRIGSSHEIHCGLSKEEPLEDKTIFVNALRSMRPGVEFRF
ncbi:hypothetical protein BGZ81_005438 [Podila clonocystis]|nr:hypothetical protein BGZ81_005438 [Podila clonocystis]